MMKFLVVSWVVLCSAINGQPVQSSPVDQSVLMKDISGFFGEIGKAFPEAVHRATISRPGFDVLIFDLKDGQIAIFPLSKLKSNASYSLNGKEVDLGKHQLFLNVKKILYTAGEENQELQKPAKARLGLVFTLAQRDSLEFKMSVFDDDIVYNISGSLGKDGFSVTVRRLHGGK